MSALSTVPNSTIRRAVSKYLEEGSDFPAVIVVEKHLVNVLADSVIETIKMITSEAVSSGDGKVFLRSQDILAAANRLGFFSYAKVVSSRMCKIEKAKTVSISDKAYRRSCALSRVRKKRKIFCQHLTEAELSELSAEQDNLLSKAKKSFFPLGSSSSDSKKKNIVI